MRHNVRIDARLNAIIPRRAFIAGLGAAALVAPAMAQEAPSVPDDEIYREVIFSAEMLAWIDAYGRPTAKVMVGDAGPYEFLVDTGANTSVVSMAVALAAGAEFNGSGLVHGTTGSAEMPMARLPVLSTGAVVRRNMRVAVFPDLKLPDGDGILGADTFAGRRVVFDIAGRSVRLESSRRGNRLAPIANLRMRNGTLAELSGRVGKVRARLMLDTGADHGIINPALDALLRRRHPTAKRIPRARISGVTGHVLEGELVHLPETQMGGMELLDAVAIACDAPIFSLWGLDDEPAMIVGVDVLSRMQGFSIDYGSRVFDGQPLALLAEDGGLGRA